MSSTKSRVMILGTEPVENWLFEIPTADLKMIPNPRKRRKKGLTGYNGACTSTMCAKIMRYKYLAVYQPKNKTGWRYRKPLKQIPLKTNRLLSWKRNSQMSGVLYVVSGGYLSWIVPILLHQVVSK